MPVGRQRVVAIACLTWSLAVSGCEASDGQAPTKVTEQANAAKPKVVAAPTKAEPTLAWIHDDLGKARGRAQSLKRPILVDMWAPWCHTCLSMQSTVLEDPALQPFADDFVWLAADTDKPQNAELSAALSMSMWPTFFVIDPADLSVHARFAGAASVQQFVAFMEDGKRSFKHEHADDKPPADQDPTALLRQALALEADGKLNEADTNLAQAIGVAGPDWPRAGETYVERVRLLKKAELWGTCVDVALSGLPDVERTQSASVTDFSYYARSCAAKLESAKGKDKAAKLRSQLDSALARLDAEPHARLSIDDRSDMLANWRELAIAMGEPDKAKAIAQKQRDLLKGAWSAATSPDERLTYMWPRAEVHVFLGEGQAIVADYEAMVAALPESYEPPYRLAWLLLQLERAEQARPHAKAAVAKLYGPRKARALALLADVEAAAGDPEAQRAARQQLVELWQQMPAGQANPKALAKARADLKKFDRAFGM